MANHVELFEPDRSVCRVPIFATTAEAYMFQFKEFMKVAGWQVKASGDGLALYSSTGDVIDSEGAGAGGMANARAWFRLVSPDDVIEYTFQACVIGINPRCRVKSNSIGTAGAFTVGGDYQTTPGIDSGAEWVCIGIGTDADPVSGQTGGWWHKTSPQTWAIAMGMAETVAPYRFWFTSNSAQGPYVKGGNIMLDYVSDNGVNGDMDNGYVHYSNTTIVNGGWSTVYLEGLTSTQGRAHAMISGQLLGVHLSQGSVPGTEVPSVTSKSFMTPVWWMRSDSHAAPNGLYGLCSILHRNIAVVPGNLDQRTQFNTVLGDRSHMLANNYVLPYSEMSQFLHYLNPWHERDKALYAVELSTGIGGGAVLDEDPPVIEQVTPSGDLAEDHDEAKTTPIVFDVTDEGTGIARVLVSAKFKINPLTFKVYDGEAFLYPFNNGSSVTPIANGFRFSISHAYPGWPGELSFVADVFDASGNRI